MGINLSIPVARELKPRIAVIGVGGAGGNAVNNMINATLEGVEFIVANTDAQALANALTERRIQLGATVTQGLGAGARPDVGRLAAEEAFDQIVEHLQGCHMAFITAGMGGGTGTGAAPVIAKTARDLGILTVGVVTKPFHFEGAKRMRSADAGIEDLQQYVDTLVIIPNQNLFRIATERTTFAEAFKMADAVLNSAVRGITDLMMMPGLINLDFADVKTVMSEMGKAMMGTGEAEGPNRAIEAAEAAIANPLLDEVSLKGAKGVLINITGGSDLTLFELDEAANRIRNEVDPEANIIVGSTFDDGMIGRMRVAVVATGIEVPVAVAQPNRTPANHLRLITPQAKPLAAPAQAAAYAPPPAPAAIPATEHAPAAAQQAHAAAQAVPLGLSVQTAAAPEPERAAPVLRAPDAPGPFVPPKPVDPGLRAAAAQTQAAAVAAAAPAPEQPASRRPNLFARVTRPFARFTIGAETAAPSPAPQHVEPVLQRPAAPAPQAAAPAPAPKPAPKAQQLPIEPPERPAAQAEPDLLDIPAFLRRQAN